MTRSDGTRRRRVRTLGLPVGDGPCGAGPQHPGSVWSPDPLAPHVVGVFTAVGHMMGMRGPATALGGANWGGRGPVGEEFLPGTASDGVVGGEVGTCADSTISATREPQWHD